MTNCPLRIINRTRLLQMLLASIFIVVGFTLSSTAKESKQTGEGFNYILAIFGFTLFIGGWLMVAYWFYQTIPYKAVYFMPAILSIAVSSLIIRFTTWNPIPFYALYMAGWATFGWVISEHIDGSDRWLGSWASILAIISMVGLMPWQRANNIVDGLGLPVYTAAWVLVSIVHAYPTADGIKKSGPECLKYLGDRVPEIRPYVKELDCVIESGCFDEISKLEPSESAEYISKLVSAIACAGEKCTQFKTISQDVECVVKNCLPVILKDKPDTAIKWVSALMQEYPACQKKCKLTF